MQLYGDKPLQDQLCAMVRILGGPNLLARNADPLGCPLGGDVSSCVRKQLRGALSSSEASHILVAPNLTQGDVGPFLQEGFALDVVAAP